MAEVKPNLRVMPPHQPQPQPLRRRRVPKQQSAREEEEAPSRCQRLLCFRRPASPLAVRSSQLRWRQVCPKHGVNANGRPRPKRTLKWQEWGRATRRRSRQQGQVRQTTIHSRRACTRGCLQAVHLGLRRCGAGFTRAITPCPRWRRRTLSVSGGEPSVRRRKESGAGCEVDRATRSNG